MAIKVVFEAGPTHTGFDSAKRLALHAYEAGADAIKFQMIDADRLIAEPVMFSYDILTNDGQETIEEPLHDILRRRMLKPEEWAALKTYCDALGLEFFITVGFGEDVDFAAEIGCKALKIASGDVNYPQLLRKAARSGLQVQLDTGNATLGEIEAAVDLVTTHTDDIVIHHCPSGYPARLEGINLNVIPTLKRMFPYPIGFSDHSPGWDMDIAAIALGADLVEKTITEDRRQRSCEHIMSLEPEDMRAFVEAMHAVETAMGSTRRVMTDAEKKNRQKVRRSAFVRSPHEQGTQIANLDIEFRRPGGGIAPDEWENALKYRSGFKGIPNDLDAGHKLFRADI